MKGSFFVGVVHHSKRVFRSEYTEKLVLYTEDKYNYLDLKNEVSYTTNVLEKDYVIEETLISTNVSEYRDDYLYMLSKYKTNGISKKKKLIRIREKKSK